MSTRCALASLTALLAVLAAGPAMAQKMTLDASCAPQLKGLQQRLYQKGNQGGDALRQFMFIRRSVYQLDIADTGEWVNALNEERHACMKRLAQARTGPQAPTQLAETSAR